MNTKKMDWAAQLRSACNDVYEAHKSHVWIDQDAVEALAAKLPVKEVQASVRGMFFPMKFENIRQEVNLMAIYHLLDFGSGFNPLLLQKVNRDAHETVQFGVLGLHLGGRPLDFHWMKEFSAFNVTSTFGVDGRDDVPVEHLPGVTMSRPGPLDVFSRALIATVHEAGMSLDALGYRDLGEHVMTALDEQRARTKGKTSAVALVEELSENIPGFADRVLFGERGVVLPFHRKAAALAAALAALMAARDARFQFDDVDRLCGDSDPLTIAALRAEGVIKVSEELQELLDAPGEFSGGNHERALRAAAVIACDRIVEAEKAQKTAAAARQGEAISPSPAASEAAPKRTELSEPAAQQGADGEAAAAAAASVAKIQIQNPEEAVSAPVPSFTASQVSAYLQFLTEEGRELSGKVQPHRTTATTAY